MDINYISYAIFFLAAGHGIFTSIGVYLKYSQYKETRYLCLFLIAFSCIILYWMFSIVGYTINILLFEALSMLLAPSIYFYISKKEKAFWPHTMPAGTILIYGIATNLLKADIIINGLNVWNVLWPAVLLMQVSVYLFMVWDKRPVTIIEKTYKIFIFLYSACLMVKSLFPETENKFFIVEYSAALSVLAVVYFTSYHAFFQKKFINNSNMDDDKYEGDFSMEEIREVIFEQRLYLNATLKVKDLAEILGQPQHALSKYLNNYNDISFNDLINEFRIKHAEYLLATTDDKLYSIALDSGFTNKVTFISNFRKFKKTTPTTFRKMVSDNQHIQDKFTYPALFNFSRS